MLNSNIIYVIQGFSCEVQNFTLAIKYEKYFGAHYFGHIKKMIGVIKFVCLNNLYFERILHK